MQKNKQLFMTRKRLFEDPLVLLLLLILLSESCQQTAWSLVRFSTSATAARPGQLSVCRLWISCAGTLLWEHNGFGWEQSAEITGDQKRFPFFDRQ